MTRNDNHPANANECPLCEAAKPSDINGEKVPEKVKSLAREEDAPGLNLIDNWEEEDVVDPYRATLGGGVRRPMGRDIG